MAYPYTYHDYEEQADDAARLTRLRKHLGEVGQQITAEISKDGYSAQYTALVNYRKQLLDRLTQLEQSAGAMNAGGLSDVRFADD